MISWAVITVPWSILLCCCAAGKPHTEAVAQDALETAVIEGHKLFLGDVICPEDSQKIKSLLGLLRQLCCVHTPCQVLHDVDSQETNV